MEVGDYVITINNYSKYIKQYYRTEYENYEDRRIPYGITNDNMLIARVVEVFDCTDIFHHNLEIKILNHKLDMNKCGGVYDVDSEYFKVIPESLVNSYVDFMIENDGFHSII